MATIINNPPSSSPTESADSAVAIVISLLVLLTIVILFFVYGLPAIRNSNTTPSGSTTNLNVTLPTGSNSTSNTSGY